jgi:hypothetical protein
MRTKAGREGAKPYIRYRLACHHTAKKKYKKLETNIPKKGIAQP